MAYSFVQYTGNGTNTLFNVPFGYISKSHVTVKVGGVSTSFTWNSDTVVSVSPAPANGAVVEVRRTTPVTTAVVDFQDAGTITEAMLDENTEQMLYVTQEAFDAADLSIQIASDNTWDAESKRIKNLAAPTADTDAATKAYADSTVNAAATHATNAANSATAAQNSANSAATSYDNFDDRYLGQKSTAPTLDNDGNALLIGALYFDTALNKMRVWDGAAWLDIAQPASAFAMTLLDDSNVAVAATTLACAMSPDGLANVAINAVHNTPGAGDLTLSVVGANGAAISPTNPGAVVFKKTSHAAVGYEVVTFTAAPANLVIPATASLGFSAGETAPLYPYLYWDGTTLRLGVVGRVMLPDQLSSSTTISTGANTQAVFYGTSTTTDVRIRNIGQIELTSGTPAGTWNTAPTGLHVGPWWRSVRTARAADHHSASGDNRLIATTGSLREAAQSTASLKTSGADFANYTATVGQYADATSLSLEAGVWEIEGCIVYNSNGATTTTQVYAGISDNPGNDGTDLNWGRELVSLPKTGTSGSINTLNVMPLRVNLSVTTTFYLKMRADTSSTNLQYAYGMRARRVPV